MRCRCQACATISTDGCHCWKGEHQDRPLHSPTVSPFCTRLLQRYLVGVTNSPTVMHLSVIMMLFSFTTLTSVCADCGCYCEGSRAYRHVELLFIRLAHRPTVMRSAASSPCTFCSRLWLFPICLLPHQYFNHSTLLLTDNHGRSHVWRLLQQHQMWKDKVIIILWGGEGYIYTLYQL